MNTKSVLDALIEFSGLDKEKCPDELKATFQDGNREYYVTFSNDRLMFECYGWEGLLLCTFVYECFPKSWEFIGWRFAFDSFAELTERVLIGTLAQDLIDEFNFKTHELESRMREITNIIKKHEQKDDK